MIGKIGIFGEFIAPVLHAQLRLVARVCQEVMCTGKVSPCAELSGSCVPAEHVPDLQGIVPKVLASQRTGLLRPSADHDMDPADGNHSHP